VVNRAKQTGSLNAQDKPQWKNQKKKMLKEFPAGARVMPGSWGVGQAVWCAAGYAC